MAVCRVPEDLGILVAVAFIVYAGAMDEYGHFETSDAEAERLAREAELINEARDSIALRGTIPMEAVFAWVDSIGTDHELAPPEPTKGR